MNVAVKPPAELPFAPVVNSAPPLATAANIIDDFWNDTDGAYEVTEQPRTVIYWTASNHVGIRQQRPLGDDDAIVIIDPERAEGVAQAILAIARDLMARRSAGQ